MGTRIRLACMPACAVAALSSGTLEAKPFDISAQPASTGIPTFARQADLQILAPAKAIRGRRVNEVKGDLEPKEALRILLRKTGIRIAGEAGNVVTLGQETTVLEKMAYQTVASAPAARQAPAEPMAAVSEGDDIIVTARKRDETSIAVPVTITAIGAQELERRGIVSLDTLTRVVPQLMVGTGGGSVQGGNIVMRGIGASDVNPFADQAVSFNIDGVQVSRATIRRLASMDLAQIEVLKGPQALFFGKNSPGGVISIRSADPSSSFTAKASLGYEVEAREFRGEGFISGPLTDTLGARVALYGSKMDGWLKNSFRSNIFGRSTKRTPQPKEFAVRGTLKFEPSAEFSARFKVAYNKLEDIGSNSTNERSSCPGGAPQLGGGPDDCKLNGTIAWIGDVGPFLGRLDSRFRDGKNYTEQNQILASNEMNWTLSDALTLTSVTGFYRLKVRSMDNTNLAVDPVQMLPNAHGLKFEDINQEIRLASSFDGPINFLAGGYYQRSRADLDVITYRGVLAPVFVNNYVATQKGEGYSVFGQVNVKPTEQLELTAGGRYSHEEKRITRLGSSATSPGTPPPVPINPRAPRRDSWNDFSPEFTISYRPSSNLTLFGSYKRGFLSGGFNTGSRSFDTDFRYDQQVIKGFEAGVKAMLFDRMLRTNLSIYSYRITGLQVSSTTVDANNVPVQITTNAGKAKTKGAEFDFTYSTPITGFTLRGALAYNDAKYDVFLASCYRGQTQALGCNAGIPTAAGIYSLQDLAGNQVVRAPKWTGVLGATYGTDINSDLKLKLGGDLTYSASYFGDGNNKPLSRQPAYTLIDATLALGAIDERWELAFIGRNLSNKYYGVRQTDVSGSGSAPGGLTGRLGDTHTGVNRGREIMLRATFRIN